jgi:hypothetical protein
VAFVAGYAKTDVGVVLVSALPEGRLLTKDTRIGTIVDSGL